MTGKTITVRVEPGSELDRALAEADDREIVLERNGTRYRVKAVPHLEIADPDDIGTEYDPEVVLRSLKEFGGAWSDIDAEALKEYTYRGREEGTRYGVEPAARLDIADPDDIWAGYDPERMRETIEQFAGTLSDQEAKELKKHIYRAREEGTRP